MAPLPQDHLIGIDVVMNRVETLQSNHTGLLQNQLSHDLPVPYSKFLADLNIMQVVLQVLTLQMAQTVGSALMVQPRPQRIQFLLNLLMASLRLQPGNQGRGGFNIIFLTFRNINRQLLVVLTDLLAEIPAAGMDNQPIGSVFGTVDLDEVIPSAQRPQRILQPVLPVKPAVAAKPFQFKRFPGRWPAAGPSSGKDRSWRLHRR